MGKPIYTYPSEMKPEGVLQLSAEIKEDLLEEMLSQTRAVQVREGRVERVKRKSGLLEVELADGVAVRALRVILAIGRSGNFRKLGIRGERSDRLKLFR